MNSQDRYIQEYRLDIDTYLGKISGLEEELKERNLRIKNLENPVLGDSKPIGSEEKMANLGNLLANFVNANYAIGNIGGDSVMGTGEVVINTKADPKMLGEIKILGDTIKTMR